SPAIVVALFVLDTATTAISTLSLHDALPIWVREFYALEQLWEVPENLPARVRPKAKAPAKKSAGGRRPATSKSAGGKPGNARKSDRKSTRLNSSHVKISYAVFCLKKKKRNTA